MEEQIVYAVVWTICSQKEIGLLGLTIFKRLEDAKEKLEL